MTLTGWPIIGLAGLAALVTGAGTVLRWRRSRVPLRLAGLLLTEALVVFSIGLVVNRSQQFYPSWTALSGETGTAAKAQDRAGRLDASFVDGRSRSWPGGTVTVPEGYAAHRLDYPVLVVLGGPPATVPGAITVTIGPGPRTPDLRDLPARLGADLRTSPRGWALVATAAMLRPAERLIADFPGQFTGLAVVGTGHAPAIGSVQVHVAGNRAEAITWASAQTAPALAPPQVLPS
ncbi:hypothetical protein AB0M54_35240 [Actinoplanes sp. NPDC051470]|uniref:hypothetical protein n=1 Tax=Actinoplanes sp. NPDC051470 TaxID=3157224 RepID=UPI00341A1B2E